MTTTTPDARTTTEDRDWSVEPPEPQYEGRRVAEISDGYMTQIVPLRADETAEEVAAEYAAGYDHGDQCVVCAPDEPRECRSGCRRLSIEIDGSAIADVIVRIYDEYDPDDSCQVGTTTRFFWAGSA